MNYFDVIIAGAGPAGSTAALLLSQKGLKVLVADKAKLPRYKTCGGGVVGRISSFLPLNFSEAAERSCYSAEIFDIKNNLHFKVKKETPVIMMTMRETLDWFILTEARKYGAVLSDRCGIFEVIIRPDHIEIETSKGKFRSKFLIAADGSSGIVSKKTGLMNNILTAPAVEYEVFVKDNIFERFNQSARFDFGIFPEGYSWVFPKRNHLSIGSAFLKKSRLNLHKVTEEYLKLIGINDPVKIQKHGFFVKLNPAGRKFSFKKIFLTGDAAGFADPLTGEGISYAVLSGRLAASAIADSRFNPELAEYFYAREINERILKELRYAKILWNIIYGFPALRTFLFRLHGQKLSEAVTNVMSGERTYSDLFTSVRSYLILLRMLRKKNDRSGVINSTNRLEF